MVRFMNKKLGIAALVLSMSCIFVGCGKGNIDTSQVYNTLMDSSYSVVQIGLSQFEINPEFVNNIEYKDEDVCYYKDTTNDVYIYAANNSMLNLLDNATDKSVLMHLEDYFLDDSLSFKQKGTSTKKTISVNNTSYTKYLLNNLVISDASGKEYFGEVGIIDYGNNEVFVLVYSDNKDKVDANYITKSLKPLDKNRIVFEDESGKEIANTYMDYDEFATNKQLAQDEIDRQKAEEEQKRAEEEKQSRVFDYTKIFNRVKTYSGMYYSFDAYHELEKQTFKDDSGNITQPFRDCYLKETEDFVLEIDVLNLNEYNDIYGGAYDDDSKIQYIKDFYQTNAGIDITMVYSGSDLIKLYNVLISNGAMETFLNQYDLKVQDYGRLTGLMNDFDQWVFVDGYKIDEDTQIDFLFTIDDYNNAYMIACRHSASLDGITEEIVKTFRFNSATPIVLDSKILTMYGEFLDVK